MKKHLLLFATLFALAPVQKAQADAQQIFETSGKITILLSTLIWFDKPSTNKISIKQIYQNRLSEVEKNWQDSPQKNTEIEKLKGYIDKAEEREKKEKEANLYYRNQLKDYRNQLKAAACVAGLTTLASGLYLLSK